MAATAADPPSDSLMRSPVSDGGIMLPVQPVPTSATLTSVQDSISPSHIHEVFKDLYDTS